MWPIGAFLTLGWDPVKQNFDVFINLMTAHLTSCEIGINNGIDRLEK